MSADDFVSAAQRQQVAEFVQELVDVQPELAAAVVKDGLGEPTWDQFGLGKALASELGHSIAGDLRPSVQVMAWHLDNRSDRELGFVGVLIDEALQAFAWTPLATVKVRSLPLPIVERWIALGFDLNLGSTPN